MSNTRFGTLGFVYPYPVYQGSLVLAAGFTRIKDFDWSLNLKGMDQGLAADHTFQHEGESALAAVAAAVDVSPERTILIDKFLANAIEVEADAPAEVEVDVEVDADAEVDVEVVAE